MDKEEVVFCVKLGLELGNRCGIVTFVLDIYLYYRLLEALQFTPQPKTLNLSSASSASSPSP